MTDSASAPSPSEENRGSGWLPRLFSAETVENWWLGIPRRLRPYSTTLSVAWSDGLYLTAWPRVSLALAWVVLLLGFLEGATHFSLFTIGDGSVSSTVVPVIFAQMLPLLFLSVLLGSLSASLGLMLVAGYAVGDFLVSGPFLTIPNWTPISGFFILRVPQLLTYGIFLGLAVLPTVFSNGLLRSFVRRFPSKRAGWVMVRVAAAAVTQGVLVLTWVIVAPMIFRVVWFWAGYAPPITVTYYHDLLDPWLPLAAAAAIVVRGVFALRAWVNPAVRDRCRRLHQDAAQADQAPAWTRRLPGWSRAVLTGFGLTFLVAGLLSNWVLATLTPLALVAICLLRNCALPKVKLWNRWASKITWVPLILRLVGVAIVTFLVTYGVMKVPAFSIAANTAPGQFGVQLATYALCLLIATPLIPHVVPVPLISVQPASGSGIPPAVQAAVKLFVVVSVLFKSVRANASCLDPSCCFSYNMTNDDFITLLLILASTFLLLGGIGFLACGLEAAAAESATEFALGDTLPARIISPLARTISPLARSVPPPGL